MNTRRWLFVTAPFLLFSLYTFAMSSSFPDAPGRMRGLVSLFLGFSVLLLIAQRLSRDDNYFVPTMVLVLLGNWAVVFSVDIAAFAQPEHLPAMTGLLLQRPQLMLYSGLLLMAWLPPLLWRGSFTFYFSRLEIPESGWAEPEFVRANRIISFYWVGVFLLCLLTQLHPVLAVQLLAPILIVMTLGPWGTRRLIAHFLQDAGEAES